MYKIKKKSPSYIGQYIRKKRLERKLIKYYLYNNSDTRTPLGRIIDTLAGSILFIVIFYMLFFNITNNSTWSLVLTVILLALFLLLLKKIRLHKYNKIRSRKNKELAYEYVHKKMMELNHREFVSYIEDALAKIYPHLCLDGGDGKQPAQDGIYRLGQAKVLIRYKQDKSEKQVGIDEITSFCNAMKELSISKGCIITTSSFDKSCVDFIKSITNLKICLMEKEQLLKLIERAGLLPDEKFIENLIIKQIKEEEKKWLALKREVLMPKKVKLYAFTGISFIVLSRIIQYTVLYIIPGIICLALAVIIYYSGIKAKTKKEKTPLDEVFDNKTS
ncbi:MAG TPA: restriction endonuclease [Clostridiales bacterium]|nr:restriction endonuclease [Clostridiales bacterium]